MPPAGLTLASCRREARRALRGLALRGPRGERTMLALVFGVAPRFASRRALRRTEGRLEWRITHTDETASIYVMDFADGRCAVRRGAAAEADLQLTVSTRDFCALALEGADPVRMVFDGRLRVSGDLDFGLRVGRCFAPGAGRR